MKTVLCCGCFDLLHPGHVAHLKQARAMGDRLIVALTDDKSVGKGPGRPVFTQDQRAEVLRELRCVDEVMIYEGRWPEQIIRMIRPDVYCKGRDYVGREVVERALVQELGGVVAFTETQKYSSTKLLEMI